ncbi:hypothetical protein Cylst_3593 [Cylindrospermum stagnale PCC 7417]|uniref:Bacterial sensory transduction regulator n=1 Tax=Cylindrospermum stagnale PCC 7417 TaxID=56107 RepID=K9X0Y9_9NOST|nr:hypothetical protein [Cylindrospermum stagnale]AFZ25729.1 hypothetical protein Cylst_3593 [Cylindrospermum stagnale PCC 7417]
MTDINISDSVAHPLVKYRNHMEFNGYHVEEDGEVLICRHPRKQNISIKSVIGRGVLIRTFFYCQPNMPRIDVLEYVNDLNTDFVFMKAYLTIDSEKIYIETFCEGEYDKTVFSILLENIESDREIFNNHQRTLEFLQ